MQKELLRRFEAFDVITIMYTIVSGIIMLFASFRLDDIQTRLLLRIAIIAIIVSMALILDNKKNPLLKILRKFYFLPILFYFISEGDYINNIFFPDLDRFMANFEVTIFSTHPGVFLSELFPYKWFSEFMSLAYLSYFFLFIYFLVYVYRRNNEYFGYIAFLISMTFYMLLFIFMLCPVAGPQFYLVPPDNRIPEGIFFREIAHWMVLRFDLPTSAFPSAMSLILCFFALLVYQNIKPLFKFLLPWAILILIATVYLKLNYAIDVIAGLLSFPAFYWISTRTYDLFNNFLDGNVISVSDFFSSIPRVYGKH